MEEMSRAERRRQQRQRRRPRQTFTTAGCRYPHLFDSPGCCICGAADVKVCPCDPLDALVHLERAHPGADSKLLRSHIGCGLDDSTTAPDVEGLHHGSFEAPCGYMIVYGTPMVLPTLAHYRWHSVYDHLADGACENPQVCDAALRSGDL